MDPLSLDVAEMEPAPRFQLLPYGIQLGLRSGHLGGWLAEKSV